jgi:hypothetical protein
MSQTRAKVEALRPLLDRVNREFCWVVRDGVPSRINEPLGDDKVAAHLDGRQRFGVCPMTPGTDTTMLGLLDFDDHAGQLDFATMRATAELVANSLTLDGYTPLLFRSTGGKGIHLFVLFDTAQNAYSVQFMLRAALASCGLQSGTGGIAVQEVEVFPKQSSIAPDGFGSMFVLPFSGKSEPLDPAFEWELSPGVPVVEPPPKTERANTDAPELSRIKSALDAIPNSGTEELSYEIWRNVLFALHSATEGSDSGLALAHDFSARSSKYDADFLDDRVWPYINSDRSGGVITARTLFSQAAACGWQDPAIVDEFEVLEAGVAPAESPPAKKRYEFVQADAFSAGKPPGWIVKNILPQAELAVIYGESGSGKSFFALDLLFSIALGTSWRGHKVLPGMRCGYVAAEGAAGFKKRLRAYSEHHGLLLDLLNIAVLASAPNFTSVADVKDLIAAMHASGRMDVIVVDTLARVTAGSNENSGEHMGLVIDHCTAIHRETGALVILIHHSGKDASKGARGWSGIKGAVDAEIEIVRAENDRVATVSKLKEGEEGAEFGFRLLTVPIGMDDDGEVISSCVVEHTTAVAKDKRKSGPKGAIEKIVWQAAIDLQGLDGGAPTVESVITESVSRMVRDPQAKRDLRRQHALRALETLRERGTVVNIDDRIALPVDANDSLV